jgi:endoglucanase
MDGFKTGVNLGGWLSQYPAYDARHFEGFISADDIARIAGWGMDHVRLPIDYRILEDDDAPFAYKESGFSYIDRCMAWCGANGLDMVLDLHRAPGYSFDAATGSNALFEDSALQDRLVRLWKALIGRYAGRSGPRLVFELLNEIVLPTSAPWNALSHRIHRAIRAKDADSWIMVGGNDWNSVGSLDEIEPFDDRRMIHTFHFYEPMPFTHQKAYWADEFKDYDTEVAYPGTAAGLKEFLERHPPYAKRLGAYVGKELDRGFMEDALRPAAEFMRRTGKPLYCGECGVIDGAPRAGRLNWYRDFIGLMREYDIGFAFWSYKRMDFGLVGADGEVIDGELVKLFA